MPKKIKAPSAKRDPKEIQRVMDKFFTFVKKNPGMRIEQINTKLGTSTKNLALPVRKLIEEKRIRTKGEKRATTYEAR